MKIALLMNHNSYCGREYADHLIKKQIKFDLLSFGSFPENNLIEDERCGNLWNPVKFQDIIRNTGYYNFDKMNSKEFLQHLAENRYDLGIQGGAGILKKEMIQEFRLGILNFHPGDLPEYRGCSTPEWQILHQKKVVATCHLINEKIDCGDIYCKRKLELDYSDYNKMRAGIYPELAKLMVEVIEKIIADETELKNLVIQDESIAKYYKVMEKTELDCVKEILRTNAGLI